MHKRYLLLILGIAAILLCLAARSKPIGYLHSWNQITTLTHISAIVDDPASWHLPHDRVTPLPHPIKTIQVAKPYDDFRVFEEFPLYHLLAAAVSHLGMSVEDAGRILSLLFWGLGAVGIYMVATLAAQPAVAALTLLLYCCSFPVAYYGVAIMSDTAMTTLWIWSLLLLGRSRGLTNNAAIVSGLCCALFSGLFKSYGLLSLVPWGITALGAMVTHRPQRSEKPPKYGLIFCGIALAAAPTIAWHFVSNTHGGHQEFESHSLTKKLLMLTSWDFWNALQKGYFRYLSYIPGSYTLIAGICWLRARQYRRIPNVIWLAALSSISFIFLTSDKIPHHDYYLLMPAVPLFVIAASITSFSLQELASRRRIAATVALVTAIAIPSFLNLKKALTENSDVLACAQLLASTTDHQELVGIYSDSSRYNSINFYARRFGVRVENETHPLAQYLQTGVRYIVTNLPPHEYERFHHWLIHQKAPTMLRQITAPDYKGLSRTCAVFDFTR